MHRRSGLRKIWAADFFTVQTLTFKTLYVFVVLDRERRRIRHFDVTAHPTAQWGLAKGDRGHAVGLNTAVLDP